MTSALNLLSPSNEGYMIKVLRAPAHPRDSCIVAVDGKLRVIDPPKPCMTYENACVCEDCKARAAGPKLAPTPVRQPWESAA